MRRIAGHALLHEGAPHDEAGKRMVDRAGFSTRGAGRAKCQCGAMSDVLPSGAARRKWHRLMHKAEVQQ